MSGSEEAQRRIQKSFNEGGRLLDLSGLGLTSFPSFPIALSDLQNLWELDLKDNELTSSPIEIGPLQNLRRLDLTNNTLTSLPVDLAVLQNLQVLILRNNQITSLPANSVDRLEKLEELDLSGNKLTSLPDIFDQLTNLVELDLSGNELTSLPESFRELQKLRSLNLSGNRFTSVPESLRQLEKLREINLNGNPLKPMPESIGQPQKVRGLDLNRSISSHEFPPDSLRMLHLSDLHFTGNTTPDTKLQWLVEDLRRDLKIDRLDFVVISGDFTDRGRSDGFPVAVDFIRNLCDRFQVPLQTRCLIVPGNHDVQDLDEAYEYKRSLPADTPDGYWVQEGRVYLVRNEDEYRRRFEPFSQLFYHPLFGTDYPLTYADQGFVRTFRDLGLQFLLLNSAWEIDGAAEEFRRRSSINAQAWAKVLRVADEEMGDDLFRIAVWHHAIKGHDQMANTYIVDHLQKTGVRLALHGDVHELRREWIGYWHEPSSLHVVGAGSFASPQEGRKESTPRLYNLLQIRRDCRAIRVHTRAQNQPDSAWKGFNEWPSPDDPNRDARYPYFDISF